MAKIHPTAIVDSRASLGEGVEVKAYAIIEGNVTVGDRTIIHPHSVINGATKIGSDCQIGPAAYVGVDPQHLGYKGAETWLVVGDKTIIRENASVHRSATPGLDHATTVGASCLLMGASHVAHDCKIGNNVVLANAALLGGHCQVADRAFLGGGCTIHQYVHIGRIAIVAGNEAISHDIPPFAAVRYRGLKGFNSVGCRRAGISRESLHAIRAAFLLLTRKRNRKLALAEIARRFGQVAEVQEILAFAEEAHRGLIPGARFALDAVVQDLEAVDA